MRAHAGACICGVCMGGCVRTDGCVHGRVSAWTGVCADGCVRRRVCAQTGVCNGYNRYTRHNIRKSTCPLLQFYTFVGARDHMRIPYDSSCYTTKGGLILMRCRHCAGPRLDEE